MEKQKTKTAACGGGGGGGGGGEDFLIEILVRLPVVSLLRFKSVCKSWLDLIHTSFFIDLHTTFNSSSSSSSNFDTFIVQASPYRNRIPQSRNEILMLSEYEHESEYEGSEYGDGYRCTDGSWHKFTGGDYDYDYEEDVSDDYTLGFKDDDDDDDQLLLKVNKLLLKVNKLELPSGYELTYDIDYKLTYDIVIAGSCNGLVCLHDSYLGRNVSLWNPATRQFRTLPKSITIEIYDGLFQHDVDFFAFGFDVKTKDYKVLRITKFSYEGGRRSGSPKFFCRAQVYSSSTDSWRLVEGGIDFTLPYLPMDHPGLYLNGSCFFVADTKNGLIINSFDFTKEIFTTIPLPDSDHRHDLLFLCCLGGEKMALFTTLRKTFDGYEDKYSEQCGCYEDCDIWVLNEQHIGCSGGGVNKESWNKLHSFQIKNIIDVVPRGISNNGRFALLQTTYDTSYSNRMQLYNLVTKEAKMDIPLCENVSNVYVYKPSLVSIIGGNSVAAAPCDRVVIGGALVST